MSYVATIKRVSDGVCIDVPMDLEWDHVDGHSEFWWEEGNYACDCNRAMEYGDEDQSCGDSRFLVRITLPDGTVPYDEIGAVSGASLMAIWNSGDTVEDARRYDVAHPPVIERWKSLGFDSADSYQKAIADPDRLEKLQKFLTDWRNG